MWRITFFPLKQKKITVSHKVEKILYNSTQTFPPQTSIVPVQLVQELYYLIWKIALS